MASVGAALAGDNRDDFGMIESLTNRWSQPLAAAMTSLLL